MYFFLSEKNPFTVQMDKLHPLNSYNIQLKVVYHTKSLCNLGGKLDGNVEIRVQCFLSRQKEKRKNRKRTKDMEDIMVDLGYLCATVGAIFPIFDCKM